MSSSDESSDVESKVISHSNPKRSYLNGVAKTYTSPVSSKQSKKSHDVKGKDKQGYSNSEACSSDEEDFFTPKITKNFPSQEASSSAARSFSSERKENVPLKHLQSQAFEDDGESEPSTSLNTTPKMSFLNSFSPISRPFSSEKKDNFQSKLSYLKAFLDESKSNSSSSKNETPKLSFPNILSPVSRSSDKQENFPSKRSHSEAFEDDGESKSSAAINTTPNMSFSNRFSSISRLSEPKPNFNRNKYAEKRKSFPLNKNLTLGNRKSTADQTPYQAQDSSVSRVKRFKSAFLPRYNFRELLSYSSDVGFIDTHCHLDFLFQRQNYEGTYADYQKAHKSTFPKCYQGCVAVFCNPYTFAMKPYWEKYLDENCVWAAFGCHPHNASAYDEKIQSHLIAALSHSKVVALGEIGLDYSNRNSCMKEVQHKVFRAQLKLAKEKQLPLVIHCREANEDALKILKEMIPSDYFIHLHCFTDTWSWAEKWLESYPNLFIGITNVVTFPSAESVHEVAKNIPLNRLLLETDAPYFIPKCVKSEVELSHPGLAIHVAAQIAAIKGIPLEEVLKSTRENTKKMYKI